MGKIPDTKEAKTIVSAHAKAKLTTVGPILAPFTIINTKKEWYYIHLPRVIIDTKMEWNYIHLLRVIIDDGERD